MRLAKEYQKFNRAIARARRILPCLTTQPLQTSTFAETGHRPSKADARPCRARGRVRAILERQLSGSGGAACRMPCHNAHCRATGVCTATARVRRAEARQRCADYACPRATVLYAPDLPRISASRNGSDGWSDRNGRDRLADLPSNRAADEFLRGAVKFCSNDWVPELARGCVRNAQWIRPNRRLGTARAGVGANQSGRRYMNRHSMHALGRVGVPVILSFGLAGGSPATAQETPPPPTGV